MSFVQQTLLITVLIPGAVSLSIGLVGRRWTSESIGYRLSVAAAAFAALFAGSWGIVGRPELVPLDISRWIVHVGALGLAAATLPAVFSRPRAGLRLGVAAAAALAASYVVLRPLLASRWTGAAAPAAVAVGGVTLLAYGAALTRVLERAGPRSGASAALVSVAAAAGVVGASGSMTVAQLGGAAGAGLGSLWLVTLFRPASLGPAAPIAAAAGWAVVAVGRFYATMSTPVAIAALAVPLVGLLAHELAHRVAPRRAALALLAGTLLTAALALALAAFPGTSAPTEDDYGYR